MVEWKKLGEICYISDYVSNGSFASLRENVQYKSEPDYAVLIRFADYSNGFDRTKFVYIDENAYNFLHKSSLEGGEIIMSNVGSCGLFFRCPVLDKKMSLAPNSILIRSEFIDYLNHWFGTYKGVEEIKKITSKSAMPKFNKTEFKKILIPIPPISEQQRIVGILDTFTASIDNLKEQIAQRRKQYEYYRDQLLDLEGKPGVEMKTVGEIALKISSGKNKTKNETGLYPVFGSTGIIAYTDDYVFDKPLILVARVGANAGFVHMSYGKYDITDNTLYVELSPNVNQKYILYLLVKENINKYAKGGGQPLITASILKDIIIPVPSLSEQQRIVAILDTFEASIQNLEAQLKEREKQYEYYRNKLLAFEKNI
ncbi:MAG: restriction endonuclease subunit S [Bacteroidaceae bacterium]|nr:restriction endonuclease subunit S [Bacteroidaceae bacterium]